MTDAVRAQLSSLCDFRPLLRRTAALAGSGRWVQLRLWYNDQMHTLSSALGRWSARRLLWRLVRRVDYLQGQTGETDVSGGSVSVSCVCGGVCWCLAQYAVTFAMTVYVM